MAGLTVVKKPVATIKPQEMEGWKVVFAEATFDDSYPTGGEALAPSDVGLEFIWAVFADAPGYTLTFTGGKLKVFWCDYDAVADGALIEVGNTEDLSGLTAKLMIVGR